MKNLMYRIFPIVILLLMAAGCDNFLGEKPRDIISPDNYFNSDKQAVSAVNGVYDVYQRDRMYEHHGIYIYFGYGADVMTTNRKQPRYGLLQEYRPTPGWGNLLPMWQDLYTAVTNANKVISNVEGNENLSADIRERVLGEALFLRALTYYHLVSVWGNVPYVREDLSVDEIANVGNTEVSPDQIRQDMINDLERAAQLLPGKYSQDERGRATKWAAKTLKVKLDLWLENWQEARNTAIEIIDNSHHRLLDNYLDVFPLPGHEFNDEIIYQIVFAKDLGDEPGQQFTNNYVGRIRDEPANSDNRAALQDSLEARNEALNGYGQLVAIPDLYKTWPDDDMRKEWSLADSLYGYELNFVYFSKLWNLNTITSPRDNGEENVIIFRMADVYLMAAEAENELNGPGNAYQYINKVRERAFEPDQPLSGLSQQQFREAIYDERKWELAGEFQRRLDLVRWGILVETVKNTEYLLYNPAPNVQEYHKWMPIPAQELQRNPNLEQNPGY